ncbi:DUF1033 family protein [Solibacillus cecembensis]|uniref:DUF1033 family protein n=1 Tax=Solibacillus cecembensis TaxID=459347 RepID=UPI0007170B81
MYKITYIKADYEPWWQFDGWEEHIVSTQKFASEQQFNNAFTELISQFRQKYNNEASKHERYYAFWSEEECEFCEACDEDAQIYHGIIIQTPKVLSL